MSNPINNDGKIQAEKYTPITTPPPIQKHVVADQNNSSLATSVQASMAIPINSAIPILTPPIQPSDDPAFKNKIPTQFSIAIASQQNKIISDMLDSWADDLEIEAQRIRDELFSPSFRAWQEWNALPEESKSDATIPIMPISIILGTIALGATISITSLPAAAAVVETTSFLGDWSVLISIIPNNYRAETGIVGSLFTAFMVNFSALQTLSETKEGEKPEDLAFARTYAINLMSKLGYIDRLMQNALANKMEDGVPISTQKKREIAAFLKSVLLCVALALIYKGETGWITGQEFTDMLDPSTEIAKNIDDPVKQQLVDMINAQLAILDVKQRENLLSALGKYFDQIPKPTFTQMLDANHILGEIFSKAKTPIEHLSI